MIFRFGSFQLDTRLLELRRDETPVPIEPQVFDVLRLLIENRDRLVSKDDLFDNIWGGRIVSDAALASCMNAVRRAVGDDGKRQQVIRTLPRRGFRFVQPVVVMEETPSLPVEANPISRDADPHTSEENSAPSLRDQPSIAVLPFRNLSGDPEQEYFADGMVDEILTALSRLRWLLVTARTSSFEFKGQNLDVREIARKLGVRYVLEGSVRKASDKVRITGQLIDATTGAHLWADRFDGQLADILDLQDRITENVVGAIEPSLRWAEIERAKRKRPESLDAYDCYLRALPYFYDVETLQAPLDGLRLVNLALAMDPNFAPANALAAWFYFCQINFGWSASPNEDTRKGLRFARAALDADPDDPFVLCNAGWVLVTLGRDFENGVAAIDKAVDLTPNSAATLGQSGYVMTLVGDQELALERSLAAMRISPTDPQIHRSICGAAIACLLSGRYEKAVSYGEQARRLYTKWGVTFRVLAAAYAQLGRLEEARGALESMLKLNPSTTIALLRKALPYQNIEQSERLWDGLRKAGLPE